jgi:hypothetical protein
MSSEIINWIPVGERSPDTCRLVLVTVILFNSITGKLLSDSEHIEIDCLEDFPDGIAKTYFGNDSGNSKVIAWAELPKGYQPPSAEKEEG